jgi:hypothetical protein
VEFPPTLDRRSEWSAAGVTGPELPPHRRGFDEYSGASGGGGVGQLIKTRSLSNWEEGGGRRFVREGRQMKTRNGNHSAKNI